MTDASKVFKEIREEQYPYFEEGDVEYYLDKNNGDVNATIYEMLLIKAEPSAVSVSGLSTNDTSAYFRRLAAKYRPNSSGILEGG